MAHIHDIAGEVEKRNYVEGKKVGEEVKFPETVAFKGFNKPSRFEGDIFSLEFDGEIPKDIDGTFYRIQPDHQFPPLFEDDIHFNGDGAVTAIQIHDGQAHFKHRFVRTDRFQHERAARRSLFGRYRNQFTDNEAVKGVIRTASNTNITFWRGVLLATKEDGPPFAMDPVSLETIGRYDFDGQLLAPTFTAHPKFDPATGEMVCFGYEAGGDGNDGSCDIVVYTIDRDGRKTEECWYKAPFCGMIHDCGLSENYVVLPMTPLKCSLDRLRRGGNHWAWDPAEDQLYGIVPRRGGKPEDIVWLRADNAFHGHVAGCYENADGHIVFDLTVADGNVFFFFPPDNAAPSGLEKRNKLSSPTVRWIFDPRAASGSRVAPADTFAINGEFSRIDDRWVTRPYNHFWQAQVDGSRFYDAERCGPPAGGLFNVLGHFTWDERVRDTFWAGPTATFQEPTFIPRRGSEKEGDGYVIALQNHLDVLRNDIVILDAQNVAAGPLAVIHLPFKLKLGLHGNFVDARDIRDWQERRKEGGSVGPAKAAEKPLPWQVRLMEQNGNANGHDGV
ncbi:putative carotenoid oxygenase protein [Neofusicoccum parvum UCRNP2]|uniref:Putative carotenoid oxygenase protein n=1 Tax=Botryosphaeria parva (strain UCR-NP2) TaxID=1287680 RepID=R1GS36_BOTPV|nr:putative carotenoid oxygenase protein [Neofusicoccum parvum UCRNP2]